MTNKNFLTKSRWLVTIILLLLLGITHAWGNTTDNLTYSGIGLGYSRNSGAYTAFSNVAASSAARYAGQIYAFDKNNTSKTYIQMRATSPSAIISTTSGGDVKTVTITWNSSTAKGRTIQVYGKTSAYSEPADLYDNTKKGTLLGTIVYGTSTSITVVGSYQYIGLRSSSNALYVDNIAIEWGPSGTSVSLTNGGCDGSGGTSKGSFTMSTSSVTTTSSSGSVTLTCTPANGYQTSSVSATDPATHPGSITYGGSGNSRTVTYPTGHNGSSTITVNFTCVTPTFGTNLSTSTVNYTQGDAATALTVGASANSATINYQWQTSPDNSVWTNTGTNSSANTSITPSTASVGTTYYRCIATNAASGCSATETSNVATITVAAASNFTNGETVFIQADSKDYSGWKDDACVKAWFNASGAGGAAQTTYWLFDATDTDAGKKLFATIVPASGDLNQVTLQRFASNCSDHWNNNGTLTKASASGVNTFRSYGSADNNVAWNGSSTILYLYGSQNSWESSLGTFADQGAGVWTATISNYTPDATSKDYKIKTSYNNGWIGNTGSNNNATLSDMKVGSTYNVTATLDVTNHSLVMSKTFVKGTVSFDLQGHGSAISDLTNVAAGSKISAPSAPTDGSYIFGGWYKEAGCVNAWDFTNDVVNESMTLYAKWYQVTLVVKDDAGTTLSGDGKPTLTRSGASLTAATAGSYVFKDIQITSGTGTLSSTSSTTPTISSISTAITITATFWKARTVTKGTGTGTSTFTISAESVAYNGSVTVTCAATSAYKNPWTLTVTPSDGATYTSSGSTSSISITNITKDITVDLAYTAKETATVKLHVAGSTSTISGTRYEGDSYTLPSEAAECPDMGLYGWYTTDYEHATTAPSGANFKLPGASATLVAGDNDFYAVYATIGDLADTYTKITTAGELTTGDYLIVYEGYSYNWVMQNAYQSNESTMEDDDYALGTQISCTDATCIWRITKSTTTITICSTDNSKYFGFTSNHVALMNASQDLSYEVSGGKWAIYAGSDYLDYVTYFQRGASKVYDVSLYKRDQSISGPYTTTPSCTTHSLSTAVTPVSTGTAVAGKTVIGEGKTTTVTATPEEGYAFRYWTISGEGSTMSNTSDGKSTDNPVTVTMGTEDATITAHFAERVAITFNVPTGVTKPSNSYTDVALPTPSGFPSAVDEDCWAFAGWTESSSVNSTSAPATLYPAGSIYNGSRESAFTLYAVYSRNKYLAVYNSSLFGDLTDYVITYAGITDHEYALTGVADDNNAVVLDVIDNRHDKVLGDLHYYTIDNPSETAVWTLSGSSGSWVLQNKATGKYLDLSSTSSPMISGSSATMAISGDDMDYTFTKSGNKLVITSSGASVGTGDPTEDEEFWLYKLSSSKYMTTPEEPTYAVTYKVSGQSDVVKNVNACTGITASDIPDAPDDDAIGDCADTFMGWSATELGSADDQDALDDLFTTYTNAPYLTGDLTLYAVFATAGGGGTSTGGITQAEVTAAADGKSAGLYASQTSSSASGNWTGTYAFNTQNSKKVLQLNSTSGNSIISPTFPGNITNISIVGTNGSSKYERSFYIKNGENSLATLTFSASTTEGTKSSLISGSYTSFVITASDALYIHSITVTYSSVSYSDYKTSCSCNGNPTVTSSASLKGTFSLSEVGVTVADLSVGSGCEWTDAGFVWSPSTNTTPTVGGTNCTKVQVLTSGTDDTFDGTLKGEFVVDATYYYRAYGKNEYESGSYQYSTSVSSFIPRSVEFDSKGGSSVDTKYVASGTPVTAPDDPTKTGYDFSKWQLSGADYNFSSNVTASITLDAVWTAQIYSITYKDQGNVAFSGSHVNTPSAHPTSHTYGTETTLNGATKSGYTFGGWYTNEDCTGDPVTTLGATAFDEDITLYAKWTAKKNYFIDRMHGNWDGEHTEPTTGYNCYVREGAGYTVPDLSDDDTGSNSCVTGHAHFVGWVASGNIGAQGQLLSGYTVIKGGTVQTAGTDGTIYYAVWAEE